MAERSIIGEEIREIAPSPEVAQLIAGVLQGHVNYLTENGFANVIQKDGKEAFHAGVPLLADYEHEHDLSDGLHHERKKTGYIDWLTITRDPETGRITAAEVKTALPANNNIHKANELFTSDDWHARMQFPQNKETDTSTPRVVIDTWRVPLTAISKASKSLSDNYSDERLAEYSRFYDDVFKNMDAAGIPKAASDVRHIVVGREEDLEPDLVQLITAILNLFDEGVRDQVASITMMGASWEAEGVMDDDPTAIEQLRVVLSGIREERQQQKREVGSPFDMIKKNIIFTGKVTRPKRRSTESADRKATQIAQGPAKRAERAARRAAQAAQLLTAVELS